MLVPAGGATVPGFCGPHTALAMGRGIGGVPELRQILESGQSLLHPAHPQVFLLLNVSRSPSTSPLAASITLHESPALTVYVAHDPSAFGLGRLSLRVPDEQQIHWLTLRLEQKLVAGLYWVRSEGVMLHF